MNPLLPNGAGGFLNQRSRQGAMLPCPEPVTVVFLAPAIAIGQIARAGNTFFFRSPFTQINQLAAFEQKGRYRLCAFQTTDLPQVGQLTIVSSDIISP
jgi:hypothetical protein